MRLFGLGLIVLSSSAANAQNGDPIWMIAAEAKVASAMRDSGSAQFINVTRQGHIVCGNVNAKNGYNGFAGSMRFAIVYSPTNSAKSPFSGAKDDESVIFATDRATSDLIVQLCQGQY